MAGRVSNQLEDWLAEERRKSLASLIGLFGSGSFAVVFVVLMALPALPLPTGGATHVLEAATMLVALQLVVGRREIWLPERWKAKELAGGHRFANGLLKLVRFFERFSRPRGERLLRQRWSGVVFGVVVILLTLTAFVSPPFSGLDTIPSLGVVVLSLGFLLRDVVVALAGLAIGAVGVGLVAGLGGLVVG